MKKFIPLILIISIILCGCKKKENNESPTIIKDKDILLTTYLEKPQLGRPKSQEPINNIFIALNNLKNATYYQSTSTGSVVTKKGSVKLTTQTLENQRIITPYVTFNESISISTFVKVAEQIYITDDIILQRKPSKISSSNISWSDKVTKLAPSQYLNKYGYSPTNPSRYIINEDTIIGDIEIINNGIGRKFTYKFNLDPTISPYYYKTNVKTLSGSNTTPKFNLIEMQMTFDYKWKMTKIEINEKYEIEVPAIGKIICFANIIESFSNIDRIISIPEASFFKKHL